MTRSNAHDVIRKTAAAILVVGAIVSLIFVIRAGQHNKSFILPLLFAAWVLSPFAGLAAMNFNKRQVRNASLGLYWLTIAIAVICSIAYTGVLIPQA